MAKNDTAPEAESAEKKVKIIIASASGAGGKDDVYVGADGRAFNIKRDHEVEVPQVVLEALKCATITEFETDKLGRFTGETREVPRFNVTIVNS